MTDETQPIVDEAIRDITSAVKEASLKIAIEELKSKRVGYIIQRRRPATKVFKVGAWCMQTQCADRKLRDKYWDEMRRSIDYTKENHHLMNKSLNYEYRKAIQVDDILIGETWDNQLPIEEIWAMILRANITKSKMLEEAINKIVTGKVIEKTVNEKQ